ncbi:DUF2087 domain-containing protein [uncultured Clostridium sp.]|uniref:DUF2087 domain-containing protein n=1 Tax=uncultured Clostridium sp. TaxID=59620 RepID=UPI0025FC1C95|nr:DUF2087 domain-containing protein [uncultured Clostridium sp.]
MENKSEEIFWNSSLEELKKGYVESEEEYKCLICQEKFERGRIFEINSKLYDAEKATKIHIREKHKSMLDYLLNMNSSFIGISETQKDVVKLMAEGLSDKEIAKELNVTPSTIRSHRYKLREKEKQAKLFMTMMNLLSNATMKKVNKLEDEVIIDAHKSATTLDDRYNITDKEIEATKKAYFTKEGAIKNFPSKEKKKIIVLSEIIKNFKPKTEYSEKEVNRILKRIFEDYVTIRRALIEYGFMDRAQDGSKYWVKY